MALSQLVQLKALTASGEIERDIIVNATIPLFQLHRVLQFCMKPRQSDDTIAAQPFTFVHDDTNTLMKATKSKKLCEASPAEDVTIGTSWSYESGKLRLTVMIFDTADGDTRHCVPRCICASGGNDDLDAINSKLITRYFTPAGSKKGATKRPQALFCHASTSNESLWASHMNHMQRPLHGFSWEHRGFMYGI